MINAASRSAAADACPPGVPLRQFMVTAWRARDLLPDKTLPYRARRLNDDPLGINDPNAILYIKDFERYFPSPGANPTTISAPGALETALRQGLRNPEPLILRAAANDCIQLTLRNKLPEKLEDGPDFPAELNQAANGLRAGQYRSPVSEYIFPENRRFGDPLIPLNLQDFGFLANGSGPLTTRGRETGATVGQLNPWPGGASRLPPVASCP